MKFFIAKYSTMEKQQTKTIKLQSKWRTLAWGNQKIVPELRINGKWLEKLGFKAGEQVQITIKQNHKTITEFTK
jgi:toxic protein SymE